MVRTANGTAGSSRAINGAPSGWTGRCSAAISVASTAAGCAEPYRHYCAERLYRRMRYLDWSGGYATSSALGRRAIWRQKQSATYLWTVGIHGCELAKSVYAYRCWWSWGCAPTAVAS